MLVEYGVQKMCLVYEKVHIIISMKVLSCAKYMNPDIKMQLISMEFQL